MHAPRAGGPDNREDIKEFSKIKEAHTHPHTDKHAFHTRAHTHTHTHTHTQTPRAGARTHARREWFVCILFAYVVGGNQHILVASVIFTTFPHTHTHTDRKPKQTRVTVMLQKKRVTVTMIMRVTMMTRIITILSAYTHA